MKISLRIIVLLIAAIVVSSTPILVNAGISRAEPTAPEFMPTDFANIHLGMSLAEVLRVRPALRATKDEEGRLPNLLVEQELTSSFYDHVIYGFEDGGAHLKSVIFIMQKPAEYIRSKIPYFLAGLLSKYGQPERVEVERMQGKLVASLVWVKANGKVIASFPPRESMIDSQQYAFVVRILASDSNEDQLLKFEKKPDKSILYSIDKELSTASSSSYKGAESFQ